MKYTIGTNEIRSLYTGGFYIHFQEHGEYTPVCLQNVVLMRWSLCLCGL